MVRKSEREKIGYGHEVKEIVNSLGPPRGFFLLRLSCFGSRMLGQKAVSRSFLTGFRSFKTFSVFAPSAISAARHGAQGAAKNTSGNTETGKILPVSAEEAHVRKRTKWSGFMSQRVAA